MQKIGVWHVNNGRPQKAKTTELDLESRLEDWIESDPELLRAGLTMIGRQVPVEGGRIDLLALDPLGRLVVIEVKRDVLRRDTIAQVLDYASCVAVMPVEELRALVDSYLAAKGQSLATLLDAKYAPDALEIENRELLLFIVGTGKAPELERMVNYLSGSYQLPVSVVSYECFELAGESVLVRELTDPENQPENVRKATTVSLAEVCELADREETGADFRKLITVADRHGFYTRPFKHSVMYAPPKNKTRMLFTVWTKPRQGRLTAYVSPQAFSEFYAVSEEQAENILGQEGSREFSSGDVDRFIESLDRLVGSLQDGDRGR